MNPSSVPKAEVVTLDDAEIRLEPWHWRFAQDRRDEIERHFVDMQSERAGVWNGRVLFLNHYTIENRGLRGTCFETDYASMCAWRDWQFPDPTVFNVFAVGAVRTADGAYLLGEMASDTASAGQIYFPCGTPEPADLDAHGVLDLAGNLTRELKEETGLDAAELIADPGWSLVRDRGYLAIVKQLNSGQSAEALRERIMRYIAAQSRHELVDIHIVRGPMDLNPRMPRFVTAFLEHAWSSPAQRSRLA